MQLFTPSKNRLQPKCCFQKRFAEIFLAILLLYSVFCIMLPRVLYVEGEFTRGFTGRISPVNKMKHFQANAPACSAYVQTPRADLGQVRGNVRKEVPFCQLRPLWKK